MRQSTVNVSVATALVNLDAIASNLKVARELSPTSRVMAVIKGDAYGHGMVEVARCLATADAFAVARLEEAVVLREADIRNPILLLEGVNTREELHIAAAHDLSLVVHSEHQVSLLEAKAGFQIWLKLETGMHRLGLEPDSLPASLARLNQHRVLGVMSHLANADSALDKNTDHRESFITVDQQLGRFQNATAAAGLDRSLANSAALLAFPGTRFEWNRPGLMLYGASPFADLGLVPELIPAMTLLAPVIAIQSLQPGESIGYGSSWTCQERCRVAVIAIGYADGYPREMPAGTPVLINDKRGELVGCVSMDMSMVKLNAEDEVNIGDTACLWGEGLPIEVIARAGATIPYTLMCGVTRRVRRIYRGVDSSDG